MEIGKNSLIDKKKQLEYTISSDGKMMDVHEVLSVLLENHKEKTILVAFFEH